MRIRRDCSMLSAAVVLLAALTVGEAEAQEGTLVGSVTNEAGELVSQAQIQVRGTTGGALSNSQGQYRLTLPPGRYGLVVQRIGSRTTAFEGIVVSAGQTTTLDLVLALRPKCSTRSW